MLGACLRHAWWVLAASLALSLAAGLVYPRPAQELTPGDDRGELSIRLDGPDGVGLAYSNRRARWRRHWT